MSRARELITQEVVKKYVNKVIKSSSEDYRQNLYGNELICRRVYDKIKKMSLCI